MCNKYKTLAIAKPSLGEFVAPGANFSLLISVAIKGNFVCLKKKKGGGKYPKGLTSTWWGVRDREMGLHYQESSQVLFSVKSR